MSKPPDFQGRLERDADGSYVGEIKDQHGWPIRLTAVIVERDGKRSFALSGWLGDPPPLLRIPGFDPEPKG